jgi:hypothetical protein
VKHWFRENKYLEHFIKLTRRIFITGQEIAHHASKAIRPPAPWTVGGGAPLAGPRGRRMLG